MRAESGGDEKQVIHLERPNSNQAFAYIRTYILHELLVGVATGIGWAWYHVPVDHAPYHLCEGVRYISYMIPDFITMHAAT